MHADTLVPVSEGEKSWDRAVMPPKKRELQLFPGPTLSEERDDRASALDGEVGGGGSGQLHEVGDLKLGSQDSGEQSQPATRLLQSTKGTKRV